MRVLITGGSGFIGTNLVSFYIERGIEVRNIDVAAPRNKDHSRYWRRVNILDLDSLRREVSDFSPTHIIHLAAQTGTSDRGRKIEDYATNFDGVSNLITVAKEAPELERIVFTSTMLVCRPGYLPKNDEDYCPPNLYGKSKVMGEKIVRQRADELNCSWVIIRPIGIWGPWFGTPYKEFFQIIAKGMYVHPGKRGAIQTLGFVGNTVHQINKLATAPDEKVHGKVFYLGDWPPVNLRDWANIIQQASGTNKIATIPVWMLRIAAKCGDLLVICGLNNLPLTSSRLKNMLINLNFKIDPFLIEDLPYTLESGTKITVNWLRGTK